MYRDLCDKKPTTTIRRSELDMIEAGIKADRREIANLKRILCKAVELYGKPGGPWSVPSEPGAWIAEARDALGMPDIYEEDEVE